MAAHVAVAVAEVAEVAWTRYEKRKEHLGAYAALERESQEAETSLALEHEENKRLRAIIEKYKLEIEELQSRKAGVEWLGKELNTAEGTADIFARLEEKARSPAFLEQLKSVPTRELKLDDATGPTLISKDGKEVKVDLEDSDWWLLVSDADSYGTNTLEECKDLDGDSYVIVDKEDVIDGVANFVARYLAGHPDAKGMTPEELQKTIAYAFGEMRLKHTMRKFWDWGRFLYTIGCWTATFVSIYKNPLIVRASLIAVWTSCRVILRMLK